LEETGLIKNVSTNKKDKRYIVNSNNEFIKLNKKLNLFSDKYFNFLKEIDNHPLLEQAREVIEKDKIGNIKSEQDRDKIKSIIFAYQEGEKIFQRIYYLVTKINLYYNEVIDLDNQIQMYTTQKLNNVTSFSNSITDYNTFVNHKLKDSNTETKNEILLGYLKNREVLAIIIKQSIEQIKKLLHKYNIFSKKSILIRTKMWSIYIFIVFLHYLNYKSSMRWPFIISDKKRIFDLNELLYEKILDVNSRLYQSISIDESTSKLITSLIKGERIHSFMNINDERIYQMIIDFQNIGNGEQLIEILNLVMKDEENYQYIGGLSIDDLLKEKTKFYQNILN
jgi:hypothetical protein